VQCVCVHVVRGEAEPRVQHASMHVVGCVVMGAGAVWAPLRSSAQLHSSAGSAARLLSTTAAAAPERPTSKLLKRGSAKAKVSCPSAAQPRQRLVAQARLSQGKG